MAQVTPRDGVALTRWLLGLAAASGLVLVLYLLQPILMPFVLGALCAYLGDPLADWLEARKKPDINRTSAVIIVFVLFTTAFVICLLVAVPLVLAQLDALVAKVPEIYRWVTQVALPWAQQRFDLPVGDLPRVDWSGQLASHWQSLGKLTAQVLKELSGSGMGLLLVCANLALVPVVAFYLMRDWDTLMSKSLEMLPRAWQARTAEIAAEADEVIGAFLRGQFLVMCALGVLYSFGLWVVGLQLALLLGMIAGLASIVPYLGFAIGITASCIAAYAQFHEWSALLWVGLVFGIGQMAESMLLTPVLVGDRIGLHPVAVIFALMAGGQIAGFTGVLLALPIAAVIMVFARHAVAHYRSTEVYGGE